MRKKITAVLIALSMTFSMIACGSEKEISVNDEIVSTETSTEVSTSDSSVVSSEENTSADISEEIPSVEFNQPWYEEYVALYYPVLQDFYYMTYYGIEPLNDEFYQPQGDTIYMGDEDKAKFGFFFDDINDDGELEMLIGYGDTVSAVCGMCGTGPFVYLGAGYRSMMTVYENGLIVYEGSSGAYSYNYSFYNIEGTSLELKDFFYTDYDLETEAILFYHNAEGVWDNSASDLITEEEYNIMTEVGLEAKNYSDKWILMSEYEGGLRNLTMGVTLEELTPVDVTWSLLYADVVDNRISADDEGIIQTLNFFADGTVTFYRSDAKESYWIENAEVTFNDTAYKHAYAYLVNPQTSEGQNISAVGFTEDGKLMVQRSFYNRETGDFCIQNEYYIPSVG